MNNEEFWKPVPGIGGHYEASSLGRIRVKDRVIRKPNTRSGVMQDHFYKGRMLRPYKADKIGHLSVHIGFNGKKVGLAVHRAVLLAFVGQPPAGQEACHNNGIAWDNRVENLRWDTHLANNRDRVKHGTYKHGDEHHYAKYSNEQIALIQSGIVNLNDARRLFGISITHFYRVRKQPLRDRFEARYGTQEELLAKVMERLAS